MKFRQGTLYLLAIMLFGMFVQQTYAYVPSRQAKFITFSNVNATEMTINVIRGNGSAAIWLMGTVTPDLTNLGDNTNPTGWSANAVYSSGTDIDGSYLMYDGTGNSLTVSGLTANTTYYVMVLEYNVDGTNYDIQINSAILNPRNKKTLQATLGIPSGLAVNYVTGTTATASWTTDGTLAVGYYIDVRDYQGAILTNYDLLDIGLPGNKRFYITGLANSKQYEYRLRPYDAEGRAGAATAWVAFTTQTVDPVPVLAGTSPVCADNFTLTATWTTSGFTGAPGTATWVMVDSPTGSSFNFTSSPAASGIPVVVDVDMAGTYVVEATISVGEYYGSSTFSMEVSDPNANILSSATSTCGLTYNLSAETPTCGTGAWTYFNSSEKSAGFSPNEFTASAIATVSDYGTYTFYWTVGNGVISNEDFLVVTFGQTPISSPTFDETNTWKEVCGLTTNLLGNDPLDYGATGSWSSVSGPGTVSFDDPADPLSNVYVGTEGAYSFSWTVANGCGTAVAGLNATFYNPPSTSDAGTDFENCGLTADLAGNDPTYGTGNWTLVSGDGPVIFSNTTTYNSSVTIPSFSGSSTYYTFDWTISNGSCDPSSSQVNVTFYNQPIANVSSASMENCGLDLVLDGNLPSVGTGSWSLVSGPENGTASFDDPTIYNTTVNVNYEGIYSFAWTVTNGTCSADAGKSVTFYNPPTTSDAGLDGSSCGLLYTLTGNKATFGVGTWSQLFGPGTASFVDVNIEDSDVDVTAYGTYTFQWSIGNGNCPPSTDDVVVTFYEAPTTASAGSDNSVSCGLLTYTLAGNVPSVGTGSWSQSSGIGNAIFTNASSNNTDVTIPAFTGNSTQYTFDWTISNGTCQPSSDAVTLTFYNSPTIPSAGVDSQICGLTNTFAGNNPTVGTGTWALVDGPATPSFGNANSYNSSATVSSYGTYTYSWTIGNGNCTPSTDEVIITYNEEPVVNAGADATACIETGYTMNPTVPTSGTGSWSQTSNNGTVAFTPSNATPNAVLTFPATGVYTFVWNHSVGTCTASDEVEITVINQTILDDVISGTMQPVAGNSNVQYSIPNYAGIVSYNWTYTSTCGSNSGVTINDNGNNVVYLDYSLVACDGTLSVSGTDACGTVSTIWEEIDVQNYPVFTGATLATTNAYVDVTFNLGISTSSASVLPVVPSDFQLIFNQNTGTATNLTIASLKTVGDGALSGGETTVRFMLTATGTPNGCETFEIKPLGNQVWNGTSSMPATQTIGLIGLYNENEPTTEASALNASPVYAVQASLAWSNGNGAKRIVAVYPTSTITTPTDYTYYNANTVYGSGAALGAGSVVYDGTGSSVLVTGLSPETTYYYAVFGYNDACNISPNYFTSTTTNTGTFTTANAATKLVITTNPSTPLVHNTAFNVVLQAQDAFGNPAYTTCDETITLTGGTGSLSNNTANLPVTTTNVTLSNVLYDKFDGELGVTFTIDDGVCGNDLVTATFERNVRAGEPTSHAKIITFSPVNSTSIGVKINTLGNGQGRVFLIQKGGTIPVNILTDGTDYSTIPTSNSAGIPISSGYAIANGSNTAYGMYLTYSTASSANTALITGLTPSTTYNFRVSEFKHATGGVSNWDTYNYKSSGPNSLNPRSIATSASKLGLNGVEIAYFDGKSFQLQVDLNWEAIREDGISYYEIYRADINDTENYVKIGNSNVNVSAGGSSKYSLTDKDMALELGSTYHYRLIGVDFNGQSVDLAETFVTINSMPSLNAGLTVSGVNPNPVKDIVRFDVITTSSIPVIIEVRNLEGQVVYSDDRMVNGNSSVEFKLNNKAAGTYFITVTSGEEAAITTFIYQP